MINMSPLHNNKSLRHQTNASATPTVTVTPRPSVHDTQRRSHHKNDQESNAAEVLVSRRRLLFGVGAGVAVAAVAGGGYVVSHSSRSDDIVYLEVPESAVTTQEDMTVAEDYTQYISEVAEFDLPYGTLVWANSDSLAACLLPTEEGSPLAQIGLLALGSGMLSTVLEQAIGTDEGFEIYDVRSSDKALVWTEANILAGTWRIYTARIRNNEIGEPALAASGDAVYDMPSIAAVGSRAFWQLIPKLPNEEGLPSYVMVADAGKGEGSVFFKNARRLATAPYAGEDFLVITPRLDMSSVYYQLTCMDAKTGKTRDTLTLPSGMVPSEVAYGDTGFSFAFDSIYSYGEGIANLGTYVPAEDARGGNYSAVPWFSFARTPVCPPAWCKGKLIVKSTQPVCSIDLARGEYAVIDVEDGTPDYGEYLASSGNHNTFVTYSNIDHTPVDGSPIYACRVKVWQPV